MIVMTLKAPLFTDWTEQYVRLHLAGTAPGTPLALTVNGQLTDFQFSGRAGWIRRHADGRVEAAVPDGDSISAFEKCLN